MAQMVERVLGKDESPVQFRLAAPWKKQLQKAIAFLVIFALRRVILLRSDIRISTEWYSFLECEGEYNITWFTLCYNIISASRSVNAHRFHIVPFRRTVTSLLRDVEHTLKPLDFQGV